MSGLWFNLMANMHLNNMDTERAIESVRINRVFILSGLNLEKM